ncbi:carbohydrate ABC transporter permease [Streptacidiphilus rugosus]|uniref:carbohydrate ABC transporter permease n=1 Tax=Streptacidiphilus rugosus TaxID=405783 RepID=UPI000564DF62|nr:sugar ABC transporter permease [Streptacidiphilus rugosus]
MSAAETRPRAPRRRGASPLAPWLLLAPALLLLLLVLGYPLFHLIQISFQNYGQSQLWGFIPPSWVGFANYSKVLGDSFFWQVVLRTIGFAAGAVVLTLVLGMLVALLLQKVSPFVRTLINISLVASWSMPIIVAVTVFKWMTDADYGVLNSLLSKIPGVHMLGHDWFVNTWEGFAVIMALVVWGAVPFVAITLYAGLTQVPGELEEAARLDGAGAFKVFRHVKLPLLKPILVMLGTLSVIWDMGVFAQVYLMRGGHPEPQYQLLSTYSFNQGFVTGNYAAGAAIAVITVLLLLGVIAVYMRQMLKIGEVE